MDSQIEKKIRKPRQKKPVSMFTDDSPVTLIELADAMRVSRWTVWNWKHEGYEFQFGNITTPGHCKAWLEQNREKFKAKAREKKPKAIDEAARLDAELSRLKSHTVNKVGGVL
jgi:malate synthase